MYWLFDSQSYLSGIEIKEILTNKIAELNSQSYLSGIEIASNLIIKCALTPHNRT